MQLLPQKAIWLAEFKLLIVADLHLGKIEHFRSSGIALPVSATEATIQSMVHLLDEYEPTRVVFLGDLFHSIINSSFEKLKPIIAAYNKIKFILVIGNHDILHINDYGDLKIEVYNEYFAGNFWLTHAPETELRYPYYNLSGHIHPGIRMSARGKQSLVLPCFYFSENQGILPAFGAFTGQALIRPDTNSRVFAIAEGKVFDIK